LSLPPIPRRLLEIDDLIRQEHYHLAEDDVCFHLWEYVKDGSYEQYPTNQLIKNLQIEMAVKTSNPQRWPHKGRALRYAAQALGEVVPSDFITECSWVPVPPSSVKSDPAYDPRLPFLLSYVLPKIPDVRELVIQKQNSTSKMKGISPEQRAANYEVDSTLSPPGERVVIFDDVIAGGSHFKAMKMVLQERFPGLKVMGLFLARTIRPNEPEIQFDATSWMQSLKQKTSSGS